MKKTEYVLTYLFAWIYITSAIWATGEKIHFFIFIAPIFITSKISMYVNSYFFPIVIYILRPTTACVIESLIYLSINQVFQLQSRFVILLCFVSSLYLLYLLCQCNSKVLSNKIWIVDWTNQRTTIIRYSHLNIIVSPVSAGIISKRWLICKIKPLQKIR